MKFLISCFAFAKFPANFAKNEIEIGPNVLQFQFPEKLNQNLGNIVLFCKTDDFLILKMLTNYLFWDTLFIKSKWTLISFPLGPRKFCYPARQFTFITGTRHPSSIIYHRTSLYSHNSSLITHLSWFHQLPVLFITHPSLLITHPSRLTTHPSFLITHS